MIHKIKALYDQGNGLTIRAIARQLGISRNTVRKYLRMDETAIAEQQESRVRHTRRPVIGSQVRSSNELAKLLRSAW